MAEIAFMKLFRLFIEIGSYFGGGIFFLNKITDGEIIDRVMITTPLQNIAAAMFVAMMLVNIILRIVDKVLDYKERKLKMERDREEINGIRKKNGSYGKTKK